MTDVTGTLVKHRKRINEIATVLVRHGLASWAARGEGIAGFEPAEKLVLISRRASPMVGPFSIPGLIAAGVGVLTWQRLVARRGPRTWVNRVADFVNIAHS
jgi:hypothetical protein